MREKEKMTPRVTGSPDIENQGGGKHLGKITDSVMNVSS